MGNIFFGSRRLPPAPVVLGPDGQYHPIVRQRFGGKRKTRRAKTIRMKKGEYLREHHHLFRVLQNPTRRALNAELRAQKRELKERGLKG
jgi:hypothetical protein